MFGHVKDKSKDSLSKTKKSEKTQQKTQTIKISHTDEQVVPDSEQTETLSIKEKDKSKKVVSRKDVLNIDHPVTIESLDDNQLEDTETVSTTKLTHVCTFLHIF